ATPEPKRYDDDSIPEEDLEFNPDATDLNEVFVEQPPSPQFTAATGTFKAIRMEAESSARAPDPLGQTGAREGHKDDPFDPTDTQVDVEIDPDLLASMAQLTSKERHDPTRPETAAPEAGRPEGKPSLPPKQTVKLQSPPEPAAQSLPPMRLAERAKARAEAARTAADRAPASQTDVKPRADEGEARLRSETRRSTALETARQPATKGKGASHATQGHTRE